MTTDSDAFVIPNTPDLSEQAKPRRLSVQDGDQAYQICLRLRQDQEDRIVTQAKIREKFDGVVPPLDPSLLQEEGKAYKSNFSTGFLQSIVTRLVPRFVMRTKASQYLTASKLPNSVENATEKTQMFRRVVTDTIRNWKGWNFFLYRLANLEVLHGFAFVGYDDPTEWRPKVFRLDEAAIPNGVMQGDTPPFFYLEREYTVSELFDKIEERELAETAGWNVDNVVSAINDAKPRREDQESTPDEAALSYEDMLRQNIRSYDFTKGYNSIKVWWLFTEEADGTVSQWGVNADNQDELFKFESLYKSMADVMQYVCYDIGDGSVYGAYGVGEVLFDLSVNIEKARNSLVDNLRLRNKFFLVAGNAADLNSIETTITDDVIYVAGAQLSNSTAAIPSTVDAGIALDRFIRNLAEEKVGAYLPDSQATDKTATQAQIDALKEQETVNSKIDFWLTYLSHVIAMIQRRMFDPANTDDAAVAARAKCLEFMTEAELNVLVNAPPAQTSIDWTETKQAQTVQYLSTKRNDPRWNQYWLERTISDLVVGPELTEAGMLPEGDETTTIEASRQQQEEIVTMLKDGYAVTVSPRDNHPVSMQTISGQKDPQTGNWTGALFALLQEGNVQGAQLTLQHYFQHYQYAQQQDQLGEYENTVKSFLSDAQKAIEKAAQVQQQYQEQQQQIAQQ